jgi:GxxExxY protein
MESEFSKKEYPFQEETGRIIEVASDVYNFLGGGFQEIIYKDAIEVEFLKRQLQFEREKEYRVNYKGIILQHGFFTDFFVFDKIIFEVKARDGGFVDSDYTQVINYLKVSGCKIALVINFLRQKMQIKRIIF